MEFRLINVNQEIDYRFNKSGYDKFPVLKIEMEYERIPTYYFYKIFLPVFILVIISLCSFFIPPKELESKLTLTVVIFLALIAYIFVIDDNIPKLSYMTVLDYTVLIAFIFTAIPIVYSIITFKYYLKFNELNRFLYLFPYLTIGGFIFSLLAIFFYHSKMFNNASGFLKYFS